MKRENSIFRPVKISFKKLKNLENRGIKVVDEYERNLEEFFLLLNPRFRFKKNYQEELKNFIAKHGEGKDLRECGNWFYFSWINCAVHFLPHRMHHVLQTGRNRYLIEDAEQEKYYSAKIGVLGLSVGSHAALTIAMTGGAKHIKLADPDAISGDNLNRVRTGFQNVGLNKAVVAARGIYEMNSYANVEVYDEGLTEKNANEFLNGLNLLIEEMDNPYLKVKVRFLARKKAAFFASKIFFNALEFFSHF